MKNISTGPCNRNQFKGSIKSPKYCCNTVILNPKFTDVFIVVVARTAPLTTILPITNLSDRVLDLVLLKRPSWLDCPHCLLYWLGESSLKIPYTYSTKAVKRCCSSYLQ